MPRQKLTPEKLNTCASTSVNTFSESLSFEFCLCSERIQEKVKRHPYFCCFWLNHLSLISDMSEAQILTSSFDWTIAICSIKELVVQCVKSF